MSLFDVFRVRQYLEDILGCEIDLGTRAALKAHFRETVTQDIARVFESPCQASFRKRCPSLFTTTNAFDNAAAEY